MLIFDSYAWIEYFLGSTQGKTVKEHLEGEEKIVTPGIILAEIARKYVREKIDEKMIGRRLRFIATQSEIECITPNLSLEAAKTWRELSNRAKEKKTGTVSLTDGIVLAATRKHQGKVITGDPHFEDLEEAIMLGS